MNQNSTETPERITALVFKDNHSARTFQIPLRWVSWLGVWIGLLVIVSAFSLAFGVKSYLAPRHSSPARPAPQEAPKPDTAPAPEAPVAQATAPAGMDAPEIAQPAIPSQVTVSNTQYQFTALPKNYNPKAPDKATLPFKLDQLRASWRGSTLEVHFAIQYTRGDGGNQQGRIVILARGPQTLLVYPDDVLSPPGSDSLLRPEQGEYFSVSRFRETNAEFGPINNRGSIREIEILIFNQVGQLLLYEKVAPEKPLQKAAAPKISVPSHAGSSTQEGFSQ